VTVDPDRTRELAGAPAPPAGPAAKPVRCASCGAAVDPLRAARVAFFGEKFRYFCSADCRDRYDPSALLTPLPLPRRRPLAAEQVVATRIGATAALGVRRQVAEALADVADERVGDLDGDSVRASRPPELEALVDDEQPGHESADAPTDVETLLLALAMLGSMLCVALALAGDGRVALIARAVLASVALAALATQTVMGRRDPSQAHPLALLAAPVGAGAAAVAALVTADPRTGSALTLAGLVTAMSAGSLWVMGRARRPFDAECEQIEATLAQTAHRVLGDETVSARAIDLRPGEEIVVEPGETVPVDATVSAGSATLAPWLGARITAIRSEGDSIVAGATVLEGRLRAVAAWVGLDRAWLRLTSDPRRRADLLAPLARAGRLTAERGGPFAAGLAALTAYAQDLSALEIAMFAVAAQAAFANAGVAQIGALHVGRNVLTALRRGIVFRSADALDRAGKVSIGAFCARGTLLLGEPEVANIEPIGGFDAEQVLALVAGAESGSSHPVATAVLRAARSRGVRPDGVRSPNVQPGLGVTAVASSGQPLVVGSRALMLKERLSVAAAETKLNELEAMGRSVLLVALGSRLVGAIGLQDGLRPGSRAAVQHLLDVGVEPVLLSGDSRDTCEAIGRALDIEHVRPEVLPTDRGEEIRRLCEGGAVVAVIGKSPVDDVALSAADVSIALGSAGSSAAEWSVGLASDDVRDAAFAVRIAHRARAEARLGLILTLAPGVAATLGFAFALGPPAIAPLAAFAGTLGAVLRLRASDV
jgi:P-type Cu+ transporter